jgi:hypothetical protein
MLAKKRGIVAPLVCRGLIPSATTSAMRIPPPWTVTSHTIQTSLLPARSHHRENLDAVRLFDRIADDHLGRSGPVIPQAVHHAVQQHLAEQAQILGPLLRRRGTAARSAPACFTKLAATTGSAAGAVNGDGR